MKKLLFFMAGIFLFSGKNVFAVCPACTVAVGAGIGLSRWLGIDDTMTGLWVGGLTVSLIMWTINFLDKKNIQFKFKKTLVTIGYYMLIVAPLYWTGIIGHTFNKIWGIDKLIIGILVGNVVFFGSSIWYQEIKKKNNGRALFPFQKVAMPVGFLAIFSVIFYFITK